MHIIVEKGGVFEGNEMHWQDCFFSFPDGFTEMQMRQQIREFCAEEGWSVEILDSMKDLN